MNTDDRFKKVPMREQDPKKRGKNFDEVPFGYDDDTDGLSV